MRHYLAAFIAAALLGIILGLFFAAMDEPRIDPWTVEGNQ